MDDSRRVPFGAASRRFMKFAGKKLQKGVAYLEDQVNKTSMIANYASPSHHVQTYPHSNEPSFDASPLPPQASPHTGYSSSNHHEAPSYGHFNPSTVTATPAPHPHSTSYIENAPSYPSYHGPPPPAQFTEPFPQQPQHPQPDIHTPTAAMPYASNSPATPLLNASGPIITQELLFQMQARVPSACKSLGLAPIREARKGLSRVLSPTHQDIELFATQLKNSQVEAIELNWNNVDDHLPCFAISYVQHQQQGRYKFSHEQWRNFHTAVQAIAAAGVRHFRVWLDQCLWLRDASQANWAHTGIVPYVLWPVIALGAKSPGGERTKDSFHRMWPFVEQLAGLWGMGLIVASEYRNHHSVEGDHRSWLSYNLRTKTEPELDMKIILLNIFHGAADALKTGWVEDVLELKEMAKANVMYSNDEIIIGSDWKTRFSSFAPLSLDTAIENIKMPVKDTDSYYEDDDGFDMYLDGSRTLKCNNWNGVREWFSGNDGPTLSGPLGFSDLEDHMVKYNVMTNVGEYQLLSMRSRDDSIWLMVAMHGRSSNFSRGRVAWTKILTGPRSCRLEDMLDNGDIDGIRRTLSEELRNRGLQVLSAKGVWGEIEWM
ncbi:hypothetical protein FGB62_103g05 [Gracilaria domingensis]|nr:hypothetical protein FGB62_103g05 [Gracilaria domingensis]